MAKRNKRNIIPKNRDIEEMIEKQGQKSIEELEQSEYKEDITMKDVISQIDKKDQELKDKIQEQKQQFNKRLQSVFNRKDAQYADELRKRAYSKAITRMEEKEQQEQEEQEEK